MTHSRPTPEPPAPRDPAEWGPQDVAFPSAGASVAGRHQVPRPDADPVPGGVRPTGPVTTLPEPPGPGTGVADPTFDLPLTAGEGIRRARTSRAPRPPRPARTPRPARSPQERAARIGTGLIALSLLLLQLGLGLGFGEAPLWSAVTLWSVFTTLATLLGALPFAGRVVPAARQHPDAVWKAAAGGLTGVAVFWVLVVLPNVDSDRGFVLTAAMAAFGAALWIASGRSRSRSRG